MFPAATRLALCPNLPRSILDRNQGRREFAILQSVDADRPNSRLALSRSHRVRVCPRVAVGDDRRYDDGVTEAFSADLVVPETMVFFDDVREKAIDG